MKPPCKSIVKPFDATFHELWCETCNCLLSISEVPPTPQDEAAETDFRDRCWRDHLHTVILAEKSLKSSPESVGGVVFDDDGLRESRRIRRWMEAFKYPSQK